MKGKRILVSVVALGLMLSAVGGLSLAQGPEPQGDLAPEAALGTAFTYQGQLTESGSPATGSYDFQFKLYNALSGGSQVGSTVTKDNVAVSNGLFTVELDFGSGAFAGDARWLQVSVREGSSTGAYTTLSPLQPVTATPYSQFSLNAGLLDSLDSTNFLQTSGGTVSGSLNVTGYLGVGTTVPQARLDVMGTSRISAHWSLPGVHSWEMGILSAGADNWFYLKDADDSDPPNHLVIHQDTGDVGIAKRLGINTATPDRNLTVYNSGAAWQNVKTDSQEILMGVDATGGIVSVMTNHDLIFRAGGNSEKMRIKANGYVGIGTNNPFRTLHVEGGTRFKPGGGTGTNIIDVTTPGGYPGFLSYTANGHRRDIAFRNEGIALLTSSNDQLPSNYNGIWISEAGNLGVGTWAPATKLEVMGTSRTQVLQITGGSDLAEPFDIAGADEVEPGVVVAIDAEHPGQLRLAERAYDRTVAGCVSGANGVGPGLTMHQEGTVADGAFPVALTGRVYCWATAANGAIEPGDLLTTSDLPGHAMKVTDYDLAQGATIGKAMSALEEGEGLILVLVTLQ